MTTPRLIAPDSSQTTALLKARVRAVFRHVPKGLAGDEESIHQMRVMGRRLRVALPLLARRPEGLRVQRAIRLLRRMTRIAGASRDLDVISCLLHERLAAEGPSEAGRTLERHLKQTRRRSRLRMAERLMDLDIARLRRDLRRVVARDGEDLFMVLSRLRQTRDAWGADVEGCLLELGDRFDPEALHRLRRRVRRLRYAAELNGALRGHESDAAGIFRDLQEKLGGVHDSHVLSIWLASQAQRAERRALSALAGEARRLERCFVEQSHRQHLEILTEQPLQAIARGLEAMGRSRTAA
jgi:CHAD domain-containing protein